MEADQDHLVTLHQILAAVALEGETLFMVKEIQAEEVPVVAVVAVLLNLLIQDCQWVQLQEQKQLLHIKII
ncbi:MAG: hypothetical protein CMK80_00290 [Pseudomonadales bacterium]|nr:hypothetical protein [Pseudomonadales bacterium]